MLFRSETAVIGVKTNIPFLQSLSHEAAFLQGQTDTAFIERHRESLFAKPAAAADVALLAAACRDLRDAERVLAVCAAADPDPTSPWHSNSGWRLNGEGRRTLLFSDPLAGKTTEIAVTGEDDRYVLGIGGRVVSVEGQWSGDRLRLSYDGKRITASVLRHGGHFTVLLADTRFDLITVNPYVFETAEEVPGGRLTALMPGRIVKVFVTPGDEVTRGQPLLIMEAMKMEHTIHSPRDGRIERVAYQVDQIVEADAVLFAFAEE